MKDLSVIIVSYNTHDLLRACLRSVMAQDQGLWMEVFVVDNSSLDGSCDMVRREFPQVSLVCNSVNVGFAAANNQGLRLAAGRYLLLLNPDTVVQPSALRELVEFMDCHAEVGYCGPKLLNSDGSYQPSARRFPTILSDAFLMTGLANRYPQSRHSINLQATGDHSTPGRGDWFSGACLLVRREAASEVGLLDEGFFMYFEETDWCKRLADADWEGWYVPSAGVVHYGGQSVGADSAEAPFSGNHPEYWLHSRRRYMRRQYGTSGMLLCEVLDLVLYALRYVRHRFRKSDLSRGKALRSSKAIKHILAPRV